MAKTNIKIDTKEYKISGTVNTDNIEEGIVLLETENGELDLMDYIKEFNGKELELSIKNKVEEDLF